LAIPTMQNYDYYHILCRNCGGFYQKTQRDCLCEICGSSKLDITPIDLNTGKKIIVEKKGKKK